MDRTSVAITCVLGALILLLSVGEKTINATWKLSASPAQKARAETFEKELRSIQRGDLIRLDGRSSYCMIDEAHPETIEYSCTFAKSSLKENPTTVARRINDIVRMGDPSYDQLLRNSF